MTWQLDWQSNFGQAVAAGRFAGCTENNICTSLPAPVQADWWAYPNPWPDTATQRNYPVGGVYTPSQCISIENGYLNVKMWRPTTGPNKVAAVIPKAAMGKLYGRYVETFRVLQPTPGFKSAHLLWPADGNQNTTSFEVDYPENEYDTKISAFVHDNGVQQSFPTNTAWTGWHTSVIEWSPDLLTFYMDGTKVGSTTQGVPNVPMDWIIQNESALNGESAAVGAVAQIQWSHVAYYSYVA